MRVTNNPRIVGKARTAQSWNASQRPLTLADYEKMLCSYQAQRETRIAHGYSTKYFDVLIEQTEQKIAEFGK